MTLQVGEPAPPLDLKDQHGQPTSLSELLTDSPVLLVFYPFAWSGICTDELTAVRDRADLFSGSRLRTVAISCDPMFTLRAWAEAKGFDFPLLSDFWPHGEVAKQYGVFNEGAGMAVRGTFLVDTQGRIAWTLVNGPGDGRDLTTVEDALGTL